MLEMSPPADKIVSQLVLFDKENEPGKIIVFKGSGPEAIKINEDIFVRRFISWRLGFYIGGLRFDLFTGN